MLENCTSSRYSYKETCIPVTCAYFGKPIAHNLFMLSFHFQLKQVLNLSKYHGLTEKYVRSQKCMCNGRLNMAYTFYTWSVSIQHLQPHLCLIPTVMLLHTHAIWLELEESHLNTTELPTIFLKLDCFLILYTVLEFEPS